MKNMQKYLLIGINILFYCLIDWKTFPILVLLILFSYGISYKISSLSTDEKWNTKICLIVGIVGILATWIYFKSIVCALPIGLSFYSFKIISYLVDIYTGKRKHQGDFLEYAIYISLFTQILSGPISRSDEIMGKLDKKLRADKELLRQGILRIIHGLFLKIVIADRIADYVNVIFGDFEAYPGLALWLAAFLYSIQIYCDFAGYSEIAIGVTNLLGIRCKDNFAKPYFAENVKEFWQRWHISLSSWLKDYIYIPLGGNRKGAFRKNLNLLATFIVSGFWHGNGSGYLVWGAFHGVLNMIPVKKSSNKVQKLVMQIVTFVAVTFGWIFFKLEDATKGIHYIKHMFSELSINFTEISASLLPFSMDNSCVALFLTAMFFIFGEWVLEAFVSDKSYYEDNGEKHNMLKYGFYVVAIILFGTIGNSSFIYMNY